MMQWQELEQSCLNCTRCPLCETRHNVVFGVGNEWHADAVSAAFVYVFRSLLYVADSFVPLQIRKRLASNNRSKSFFVLRY